MKTGVEFINERNVKLFLSHLVSSCASMSYKELRLNETSHEQLQIQPGKCGLDLIFNRYTMVCLKNVIAPHGEKEIYFIAS